MTTVIVRTMSEETEDVLLCVWAGLILIPIFLGFAYNGFKILRRKRNDRFSI